MTQIVRNVQVIVFMVEFSYLIQYRMPPCIIILLIIVYIAESKEYSCEI